MIGCVCHQAPEVFTSAKLRVNGLMPALLAADGVGAAGIIRARLQRIVRTFTIAPADGVNRRKVQHVKAHVVNHRQPLPDIIERTVTGRIIGHRARKKLVPAGKLRQPALNLHRIMRTLTQIRPRLPLRHQLRAVLTDKQRHLFGLQQAGQITQQCL